MDKKELDRLLEESRLREEKRKKYPADMGFYPLTNKFSAGPLKTPWLQEYLQARGGAQYEASLTGSMPDPAKLRATLVRLGADASVHIDRYRGAMVGLAVGDALGMPLEFAPRDQRYVDDMVAGGPFNLEEGQWTDDASMACCLAYSLITCHGFDPKHQMDCYTYWYRYGVYSSTEKCFDIGNTVKAALDRYLATGDHYAGSTDPGTAGNGSLMRLVPVVLFYFHDFENAIHFAEMSSRTTHQATEAIDACRYFAALLFGALKGDDKAVLLSERYTPIPGYWDRFPLAPKIDAIARGAYKTKERKEIASTPYVVHTLEAALWAFHRHASFRAGALEAVNLAGDSDTIGAVFGQIAGAYYAETSIPSRWISKLTLGYGFYHFAQDLDLARPATSR
jgi:ADP-ribosyl-[dinitrogen reductase] hydrolase